MNAMECVKVSLLVVVMLATMDYTQGCTCMPAHMQHSYCQSDYVVVARVRKEVPTPGSHRWPSRDFKVMIKKKFKVTDEAAGVLEAGRITTAAQSAACGVQLKLNETYLLMGRVRDGKASINLCDVRTPWREVTSQQRKGVRRLYQQGCACRVDTCFNPESCSRDKGTCNWSTAPWFSKRDCQYYFGICAPRSKGRCGWIPNRDLASCMKPRRVLSHPNALPQMDP